MEMGKEVSKTNKIKNNSILFMEKYLYSLADGVSDIKMC